MIKAEDSGIAHNSYDEVLHYHYLFMMQWSSEGISWHEARNDDIQRIRYNELLFRKNCQPIAIRDKSDQYQERGNAVLDWTVKRTITTRLGVRKLKHSIYQLCLTGKYGLHHFLQLADLGC